MKRNIILYSDNRQQPSTSDYVLIDSVDNIVNFSVDNIFCDCLESLDDNIVGNTIQKILHKIRPEGYIHFKILDIKALCIDAIQNKISFVDFLRMVNAKRSILTLDVISSGIDFNTFEITKLSNNQYYIDIILKRIAI